MLADNLLQLDKWQLSEDVEGVSGFTTRTQRCVWRDIIWDWQHTKHVSFPFTLMSGASEVRVASA